MEWNRLRISIGTRLANPFSGSLAGMMLGAADLMNLAFLIARVAQKRFMKALLILPRT